MDVTAEKVKALREFSGEGIMQCKSCLVRAKGDVSLAYGYLRATGCLVATQDRESWETVYAKSWLKDIVYIDGKLEWVTT